MEIVGNYFRVFCHLFAVATLFGGCSAIKDYPKSQIRDGSYKFKQGNSHFQKAYAYVKNDTVRVILQKDTNNIILPANKGNQIFLRQSFDLDLIVVPFKYRPATTLPRQLTTEFNGNVFVGYRVDRYSLTYEQTRLGLPKSYKHYALSIGGFAGLGSTSVTPWTTNYGTTEEYMGLVLTRGLGILVGVNNLTVGAGVGWDILTDRDRNIWVYQNKAWYGLTLGLNLN
ncbi:hypothetical protein BH09BAC3_BH09BAC3_14100 [soil metagenome]